MPCQTSPDRGQHGYRSWLRSPALDVCLLGSVSATTLRSPQGFSRVNSLPVGSKKCFKLNALETPSPWSWEPRAALEGEGWGCGGGGSKKPTQIRITFS